MPAPDGEGAHESTPKKRRGRKAQPDTKKPKVKASPAAKKTTANPVGHSMLRRSVTEKFGTAEANETVEEMWEDWRWSWEDWE